MASVWAIKNGDWSDTTVWNTGALPTTADDVYTNNFSVNVNQSVTVLSLRSISSVGISAGGNFTLNTASVTIIVTDNIYPTPVANVGFILITCTSGTVIFSAPNSTILTPTIAFCNIFIHSGACDFILSAIRLINGGAGARSVFKTSVGNLIINAEITGGSGNVGQGNGTATVVLNSNSNTTINGNITGGSSTADISRAVRVLSGNLTVNGNVLGGSTPMTSDAAIRFESTGDLNIIGNVSGNISYGIVLFLGVANITGAIIGGNSAGTCGVIVNGAILHHVGPVQASAVASAIVCNSPTTSMVTCTGPFLKSGFVVALASQVLKLNFNSNSYFQFKKLDGDDIDYVSTIEGYNYPTASDVRDGIVYKSGLVTGTLKVPNPADVRKSIPTDNTVGTADITPEDFITALETSSAAIAQRLRNCATVESTGAQVAAYE